MKKRFIISRYILLLLGGLVLFIFSGCKKYLDEKPDKKIVIATTLQDAQALLDDYTVFNSYYPSVGDQSDDNYFLDDDRFNMLYIDNRNNYVWAQNTVNDFDWGILYQIVLNATIALETVNKIPKDTANENQWNSVKGAAYFYRGYALFQVAQYYAGIYDSTTAAQNPGIPLRPSSDATIPSTRATMQDTWAEIINCFHQAAALLPTSSTVSSRPTKAAAWGALARTYLVINKYVLALNAADTALQQHGTLIDFNTLDIAAPVPFTRFNAEVIFPSTCQTAQQFDLSFYSVDTALYASYVPGDLRKDIYFIANSYGYGFKGNYDGDSYSGAFNGIATDELLLIKAECLARAGNTTAAMATLNRLLLTRWKTGTFVDFTATSANDALQIILTERRKELILRGTRWFDLKRLSKEPLLAVSPKRWLNATEYILEPNSKRYIFLIPRQVIELTGMEQNIR